MSTRIKKENDHQAIKASIEKVFADIDQAFAEQDIEKALSFFADSENMIKISNGIVLRGKEQLSDYWQQRIGGKGDVKVRLENVEIHPIDATHVWVAADEYISIGEEHLAAVVTNILVVEEGRWKILLDHTTYLPPD